MKRRTARAIDAIVSKRVLVDPLVTAALFGAYLQAVKLLGLDDHAALLAANVGLLAVLVVLRVKWQQLDDGFDEYFFGSTGDDG